MGLPQPVHMVFGCLRMDWDALMSCSLTCRALHCSARRLIHERLYVVGPGPKVLPFIQQVDEMALDLQPNMPHISLADGTDLVQYIRNLTAEVGQVLTQKSPAIRFDFSEIRMDNLSHPHVISYIRSSFPPPLTSSEVLASRPATKETGLNDRFHLSAPGPWRSGI